MAHRAPTLNETLASLRATAEETRLRILALLTEGELFSVDRERLAAVRKHRAEAAQGFFARLAPEWDRLRSLQAPEDLVEQAILEVLGPKSVLNFLDLGTGTGRMLQLL